MTGKPVEKLEIKASEQVCDWNADRYKCRVHPTCESTSKHIRVLLEENERLRAHTKKCNDLVLRLARQAAKDQGFELGPKHDVQGLLAGRLQAGQIAEAENERLRAEEKLVVEIIHDTVAKTLVLEARIEAALALHPRHSIGDLDFCPNCSDRKEIYTPWPCPTVKALKGETP